MWKKPVYLWPCILVYKIVKFIVTLPIIFLHYLLLGFFFTFYFAIDMCISLGVFISRMWYRFVRYFFMGCAFPFVVLLRLFKVKPKDEIEEINRLYSINQKEKEEHNKKLEKIKKQQEEKLQAERARLEKIEMARKKEEERLRKEENAKLIKQQQKLAEEEARRRKIEEQRINAIKNNQVIVEQSEDSNLEIQDKPLTKKEQKRLEQRKLALQKEALKEQKLRRKLELADEKKKLKEKNVYINENAVIEKKKLGDSVNKGLESIASIPNKLKDKLKASYNNSVFVKNKKNQETIEREALLIDFDSDDAKKNDRKVVYEYVAKNTEGQVVKDHFEAFSKVEVHSFLLSEGYEVYSIKTSQWIQFLYSSKQKSKVKFKTKDLLFFLTQLSTYIKAGIPLVEALRILSRQFDGKNYSRLFRSIIYDLTMGDNFSDAMAKQGDAFPRILVNMVKASEMTGELPETLDDMFEYFTESDKTRKQMVTAMTYPTIIFSLAVIALGFIMIYIVPKFTEIYEGMDNAELPWITVMITNFSNYLANNYIYIILVVFAAIIVFRYLYKNVKLFRTFIQYILMHIPIIKNIIIYNEVTMFTKTFASLLKHNVFITDTMEILNKITNNEVWKMLILDTITNLAKGEKISTAFKDHWAVPMPAYEMIVTGERTGQLPEMMQKVSDYYQELHKNAVGRIKSFIEPILILFLTLVVGVIVLSIVIPMFGMYDSIG